MDQKFGVPVEGSKLDPKHMVKVYGLALKKTDVSIAPKKGR